MGFGFAALPSFAEEHFGEACPVIRRKDAECRGDCSQRVRLGTGVTFRHFVRLGIFVAIVGVFGVAGTSTGTSVGMRRRKSLRVITYDGGLVASQAGCREFESRLPLFNTAVVHNGQRP